MKETLALGETEDRNRKGTEREKEFLKIEIKKGVKVRAACGKEKSNNLCSQKTGKGESGPKGGCD